MISGTALNSLVNIFKKLNSDVVYYSDKIFALETESGIVLIQIPEFEELPPFAIENKVITEIFSLLPNTQYNIVLKNNELEVIGTGTSIDLKLRVMDLKRDDLMALFNEHENSSPIQLDFVSLLNMEKFTIKKISDLFSSIYLFSDGIYTATPSFAAARFVPSPTEVAFRPDLLKILSGATVVDSEICNNFLRIDCKDELSISVFIKVFAPDKGEMIKNVISTAVKDSVTGKVKVDFTNSAVENIKKILKVDDVVLLYQRGNILKYNIERPQFKWDDVLGIVEEGGDLSCRVDGSDFLFMLEEVSEINFLKDKLLVKGNDDKYVAVIATI